MAKKTITKQTQPETAQVVVNEIRQVNVDRTPKAVSDWRHAHRIAENVDYPNRSRLLDLYEDVALDGHLTGVWQKRQSATTNKEIKFINNKNEEITDLNNLFETEEWEQFLNIIIDAKLWGLNGVEFIPGNKFAYEIIPRKHILIEKEKIKINQNDADGIDYKDNPYILVFGKKHDLGIMLKCSFYALIKKGNFSDWAQYSEIFGQPMRVAYYDAYDDKSRMQLQEVLNNSGSSLALMIPSQAKFEVMDGKTSNGDGQLQERLKNACNSEMSIIVLGNTETTSNDNGGSQAKAEVQQDGESEVYKKDLKWLLSYLNSTKFLSLLTMYGYPVEGGKFVIQQETDTKKLLQQVEIVTNVRNSGTPIADDYVYEITGIPKPVNYEKLKAEQREKQSFGMFEMTPTQKQQAKEDNPKDKKEDKEEEPDDLTDSIWNRIRTRLADFFAPAP